MKKELLNQLEDFEIFVERMEKFVDEIKSDEILLDFDSNFNHYDLRTKDGDIFPLPNTLQDYLDMWKCVAQSASDYYRETDLKKRELYGMDGLFFDLYWNDVEGNSAYYQDMVFWVYFSDDKGICYDVDETDTPY